MNILVTGGAGFIGSAVVDSLILKGHCVTVVDNFSTGIASRVNMRATVHRADLLTDDLTTAFRQGNPEVVIHLAARTSVVESMQNPASVTEVNVYGTRRVIEQSVMHGVGAFVFASTGGALYGDAVPLPTPESFPPAPVSPYGISKAKAEKQVSDFCQAAGARWVILRFGNVYGPGQNRGGESGVVPTFMEAIRHNRRPIIYGDGKQTRDYVYIDDIVDAHMRVLVGTSEGIFNLGTGSAISVREVFDTIAGAAGYHDEPIYAPARAGELLQSCLDSRRARELLGWAPKVSFFDGIRRTFETIDGLVNDQ